MSTNIQLHENELIAVMSNSLYPGAKPASIRLVLNYCKARGLNPLSKPVHIVPMSVKVEGNKYVEIDVIMPGINQYRVEATATGQYMGMSKPEYGPERTLEFEREVWVDQGDGTRVKRREKATLRYPEWCEITIKRRVGDVICEWPSREIWLENVATDRNGVPTPMWQKRPTGQLTKCTEAQALRRAFSDKIDNGPTAEEMEGRRFYNVEDENQAVAQDGAAPPAIKQPRATGEVVDVEVVPNEAKPTAGLTLTQSMVKVLLKKLGDRDLKPVLNHFGVDAVEKIPVSGINDALKLAGGES